MRPHELLEAKFAEWAGVHSTVACSSGTAALHLALEALQLPQGSHVLVPDFTMVACARAVHMAGLRPAFVGCDDRLCISPAMLEVALGSGLNISAVMAVHVYGRRCSMEAVHELASKFGVVVVEDLAEAHGVKPHPATDAACWSFYRNKIVAGEEGGMVAFAAPWRASVARAMRCLGFTDSHDFYHTPRGYNYRLADCLAEKVLASLQSYDGAARRAREALFDAACPEHMRMPERDAVWVYDFKVQCNQELVVQQLRHLGCRHAFKPMSWQPEFQKYRRFSNGKAERAATSVVYVPLDADPGEVFRTAAACTLPQ